MTAARLLARVAGGAAALGVAAVLILVPADAAQAHDYLVASTPAAGSTIHSPVSTVSLTFDDIVLDYSKGSTALLVTGPGRSSRHFETTCATIDNRTVSAGVALGRPGVYTVTWRVVSADGHPVTDSIRFTYAPSSSVRASAGTPSGPSCGLSDAHYIPYGGPSPGISPIVWFVIGGGVLLVLAAIIVVIVVVVRTNPSSVQGADGSDPEH